MIEFTTYLGGYEQGEKSLFQFLEEMTFIDVAKLKRHYTAWTNADVYKTLDGEKKGFKSMLKD